MYKYCEDIKCPYRFNCSNGCCDVGHHDDSKTVEKCEICKTVFCGMCSKGHVCPKCKHDNTY